jgi:hypothetical protein
MITKSTVSRLRWVTATDDANGILASRAFIVNHRAGIDEWKYR